MKTSNNRHTLKPNIEDKDLKHNRRKMCVTLGKMDVGYFL
jgi:hypothetical protein